MSFQQWGRGWLWSNRVLTVNKFNHSTIIFTFMTEHWLMIKGIFHSKLFSIYRIQGGTSSATTRKQENSNYRYHVLPKSNRKCSNTEHIYVCRRTSRCKWNEKAHEGSFNPGGGLLGSTAHRGLGKGSTWGPSSVWSWWHVVHLFWRGSRTNSGYMCCLLHRVRNLCS